MDDYYDSDGLMTEISSPSASPSPPTDADYKYIFNRRPLPSSLWSLWHESSPTPQHIEKETASPSPDSEDTVPDDPSVQNIGGSHASALALEPNFEIVTEIHPPSSPPKSLQVESAPKPQDYPSDHRPSTEEPANPTPTVECPVETKIHPDRLNMIAALQVGSHGDPHKAEAFNAVDYHASPSFIREASLPPRDPSTLPIKRRRFESPDREKPTKFPARRQDRPPQQSRYWRGKKSKEVKRGSHVSHPRSPSNQPPSTRRILHGSSPVKAASRELFDAFLSRGPAQSISMDPLTYDITEASQWEGIGPQPSPIAVSRLFVLQPDIEAAFEMTGMNENRDSVIRLAAAEFIDALRKAMMFPVTVYNTACVLFARLRLDYSEKHYGLHDACIAAVFLACKQEDIFKKVKEIVAAANNLQNPGERVYPDDTFLDAQLKRVLQLERMLIEACRMDFRTRHPHKLALQLAKQCDLSGEIALKAYNLTLDLHRTWAPLKQNAATMAIACVELATKFCELDPKLLYDKSKGASRYIDCDLLESPRHLVIETMNELLEIYSFSVARQRTLVGKDYTEQHITKLKLDIVRENKDLAASRDTTDTSAAIEAVKKKIAAFTPSSPTSPATPTAPRGPLNPTKPSDNTIRFVLDPQEMIEERLAQSRFLPPELRKSDVPHWFVEFSDGKKAEIKCDGDGRPLLSANGHPLDREGKEVKVRNSYDARKKLEKQVKDGEFARAG